MENDGAARRLQLRAIGRKVDGQWTVRLGVGGGIGVSGGPAPELETAIEFAAAAAAKYFTRIGAGEKYFPEFVIEQDDERHTRK